MEKKIKELFNLDMIEQSDYTYLSNVRQISLAKECLEILSEVENAVNREDPVDLIEIDLKQAFDYLGNITGDSSPEELITALFTKFCLGK